MLPKYEKPSFMLAERRNVAAFPSICSHGSQKSFAQMIANGNHPLFGEKCSGPRQKFSESAKTRAADTPRVERYICTLHGNSICVSVCWLLVHGGYYTTV